MSLEAPSGGRDDPMKPFAMQADQDVVMPPTNISPSKRIYLSTTATPLESPDMKSARNRLGNLLSSIKSGEIQPHMGERSGEDEHQMLARPKKWNRRDRRVVFELRGKPFGIRDNEVQDSVFSLTRQWIRGREHFDYNGDEVAPPPRAPSPADRTLDLLATKEIHSLPGPRHTVHEPRLPIPSQEERFYAHEMNPDDMPDMLSSYTHHWRGVKNRWRNYSREKQEPYTRGIRLLETVFRIAQQNQHY